MKLTSKNYSKSKKGFEGRHCDLLSAAWRICTKETVASLRHMFNTAHHTEKTILITAQIYFDYFTSLKRNILKGGYFYTRNVFARIL